MDERPSIKLFRQEAVDHQRDGWMGEILLSRPLSYTMLTWMFAVVAAATLAFTWKGEYTKKARASGYIVPDQGLLKIYPQAPGFVLALKVKEGQDVQEGQVLAVITTERIGGRGNTQEEIAKSIEKRRKSLTEQAEKTHTLFADQIEASRKRLAQLTKEQHDIADAIQGLRQRVANAEKVVARYAELQAEKFVPELMVTEKQSDLLDQKNRLNEAVVRLSTTERDMTQTQSDLVAWPIKEKNELAAIDRAILELDSTGLENEARRESFIVAPQSGTVTQLQADKGKQVSPAVPMMNLIPSGSVLIANLYVPSRSIGFVKPGIVAQMQYQAFPYQKFGTQGGRVVEISRTAVPAAELPFPMPPTSDVFYVVTVRPDKDHVLAYGIREPLHAGMQLEADIWLERRTIFEWMLEPLYSISGRA